MYVTVRVCIIYISRNHASGAGMDSCSLYLIIQYFGTCRHAAQAKQYINQGKLIHIQDPNPYIVTEQNIKKPHH